MIVEEVIENGKTTHRRNIFNATMRELKPKDRKFIHNVKEGRGWMIVTHMSGKQYSYLDLK